MCGLIVRVRVVPTRTVVGDIDRRFDNLSGSHHQSHVNCVSSVYGISVSGQLSRDIIGCQDSNRWLRRNVIDFGSLSRFVIGREDLNSDWILVRIDPSVCKASFVMSLMTRLHGALVL